MHGQDRCNYDEKPFRTRSAWSLTFSEPRLHGAAYPATQASLRQCVQVIDDSGQRPTSLRRYNMSRLTMNAFEPVYMELVDFVARGSTAEEVANFRPSPEAQKRVAELLEKQRESHLTDEETSELDGFVQIEHILGLARAKAQLILAARS